MIKKLKYIDKRVYIILKATLINKQCTNFNAHNNNDKGLIPFSTDIRIEISPYSSLL